MLSTRTTAFLLLSQVLRRRRRAMKLGESESERSPEIDLRSICESLRGLGVVSVKGSYNGLGDDGAIEDLDFDPSVEVPQPLTDRLEDWIYEVLPEGWEINEGSEGTFEIDVVAATACIEHGQNVLETVWETYEIGGEGA
jgi:hypothetical protein